MNYLFYLNCPVSDDIFVLHNAKKGINFVALNSKNAAMDKKIWKNVREDIYLVVLALPEIFFQPTSMFQLSIMREKNNAFS